MGKHRTTRRRNRRQKLKARYAKRREEAQLTGLIPTVPEGAVRNEVVDPRTQSEQRIPSLDWQAIYKGWKVPEEEKPRVIDRLLEPFDDPEADFYLLIKNFSALLQADQKQHEREHAEEAGTRVMEVLVRNARDGIPPDRTTARPDDRPHGGAGYDEALVVRKGSGS
jgi:hypothetical protein